MTKPRARDLGIPFTGHPGPFNAITDVPGVQVGYTTLILGSGELEEGLEPVRTGVTAVLPRGKEMGEVFAAWYSLNGCGEMTGTTWVEESGQLLGPILLTNTFSVGAVFSAVIHWVSHRYNIPFGLPLVTETFDGYLNDVHGFHVKAEHVYQALDSAAPGPVAEGNVGGGTGMICHGFKGGTGTASRRLSEANGGYTLGILVQANHGDRDNLTIAGVPVGQVLAELPTAERPLEGPPSSSIIVILATDCPLLPHQLKRLARRVPMGIGIVGGRGENFSGDIFLAFSTAPTGEPDEKGVSQVGMLANRRMDALFNAAVQATEEAIVNALVAAETMQGRNGHTVHALPHDRLRQLLELHGRLVVP
jgi:D-aminopeptidase